MPSLTALPSIVPEILPCSGVFLSVPTVFRVTRLACLPLAFPDSLNLESGKSNPDRLRLPVLVETGGEDRFDDHFVLDVAECAQCGLFRLIDSRGDLRER